MKWNDPDEWTGGFVPGGTLRVGGINAAVVCQAPDMIQVVSVGQDRSLTFWDLKEAQPLQVVPGAHAAECTCAALSSAGVLATVGGGGRARAVHSVDPCALEMRLVSNG